MGRKFSKCCPMFSLKYGYIEVSKDNLIKCLQNRSIWSHYEVTSIEFQIKNFWNFFEMSAFSRKKLNPWSYRSDNLSSKTPWKVELGTHNNRHKAQLPSYCLNAGKTGLSTVKTPSEGTRQKMPRPFCKGRVHRKNAFKIDKIRRYFAFSWLMLNFKSLV